MEVADMVVVAELIQISPAIFDPNDFKLKKAAVIKLNISMEGVTDGQAIGSDAEAELERQIGKEIIRVIKDAKTDYLIPNEIKEFKGLEK